MVLIQSYFLFNLLYNKFIVNNQETTLDNLGNTITQEKNKMNKLNESMITINIYNDINTPMKMVIDLKQILREKKLLKICYMGIAQDDHVSKLETRYVGVPRKLPPLVGTKTAEVIEIVPDTTRVN